MAKEKKAAWFRMCLHQRSLMEAVPDETLGRAMKAVMLYFDEGETKDLQPLENAVFQALKPWVDMATEDYKQSIENGKKAAKKKAEATLSPPDTPSKEPTHKEKEEEQDKEQEEEQEKEKEVREKEKEEESVVSPSACPTARTRFVPPDVSMVRDYCRQQGYEMDAQRFVDYYTSVGWKVGKSPMKDWKAAVRNWHRKEEPRGKAEPKYTWTVGHVL